MSPPEELMKLFIRKSTSESESHVF